MSLKYILGGSGTGKTTTCLNEIIASNQNIINNSLIFIVPEQFSLESEKSLISLSDNEAMIQGQVLSFQRLAFHLFSELGNTRIKLLEDNGKNMLLRKIVNKVKDELLYYKKSIDKQGFMDSLSKTITEFYQYTVSKENFQKYLTDISDKETLYTKMSDLYKIYDEYLNFIKDQYISTDETLDIMSEIIKDSNYLKDAEIWIDGFNGFTPQEYKVIEKLLLRVKSVNIAFTVRENNIKYEKINVYDPFFETKTTINKITKIAKENNIKVEPPIFLEEAKRFENFKELKYLEKNYFSYGENTYKEKADNIIIFKATNLYSEVTEIAKQIHHMISAKNYKYSEIALLTGDLVGYEKSIRGIFKNYNIPCFFDLKTDILSHPLTELIRSAVDIIVSRFSYESIFRFLKTNMTDINRDEIDMLENYVLAYGIKGYKWDMEEWKYGFSGKYEIFDYDTIHNCKKKVLEILKPISENIQSNSKVSIKDFSYRIFHMLINLNVTDTLNLWISNIDDKNSVILRQHNQIWGKITRVFEKMVEILGDEIVTVKEFSKILEVGLASIDMGIIPPSQDCVIIGDFQRTRLPEIKAMFVLGVNEGVLPKPTVELGLFSDEERLLLNKFGMELSPDSARKAFEQQFQIYNNITKPSKLLHISYSLGTLSGKSLQPSSIIAKIKKLIPNVIVKEENDNIEEITLPVPMFENMGKVLRAYSLGDEISPVYLDMYSWFMENDVYKEKIIKMQKILFEGTDQQTLESEIVHKLYGKELITTVSRLEKYVHCPFAYFVEYNLEAKERKTYEVNSMDFGNLFHEVIDMFSTKLDSKGNSFRDINKEDINVLVDVCVDEIVPKIGSEVLLSSSKYQYIIKRIKRISKKSIWALSEHIKAGLFEPLGSEIEFSSNSPLSSISININDKQKMIIVGKIDRVDILDSEGNKYIKIIDYKSGSKKFDLVDIYYGMQLQLIMYMDAFIKNGENFFGKGKVSGKVLPGGVFYFNIDDPILDFDGEIVNEKIDEMILKEFKMSGLVLADKIVIDAMDKDIDGDSKIIPVNIKKKDGSFGARSSCANLEEFYTVQDYVNNKIIELGKEIFSGKIDVFPYKKGNITGCTYCKYAAICKIDTISSPNKYNIMKKINTKEEIFSNRDSSLKN